MTRRRRYWWILGWHRTHKPSKRTSFSWSLNLSSINLPRISGDWADEDRYWVGITWGDGNSDPVWSAELTFPRRPPS